ncbi:unnamed protein product [Pieris macdunnoughi]|uniref:MADF domain-containing protein n=1 Tax=Pieris macdunnoughi TaxID=345717 RepID=A0A821VMH1_9NEOP|nr:unnamed protein product [Pieris macdunnoughi]
MDTEKVEKLIESVRGHIFLYDLGNPQYKNASLKSATWESIGRELNESGEAVRSKWKTVRDGYTKYKKQLRSSTCSSRKNFSYTWASQLAFLDNFNEPRASFSKVSLESTQRSPRTPVPPADTPTASTSGVSYRNKRRSSEIRRNEDGNVGRVLELLNAKKKKEHDVIDHLFLSYADTFKKFPAREQAIVKLELAKLFANTELQLLNGHSSVISVTNSSVSSDENRSLYSSSPQIDDYDITQLSDKTV